MSREFRQDEKTVFFAMKIVVPIVLGLVVAASADIASAKKGSTAFFESARAACVVCGTASY